MKDYKIVEAAEQEAVFDGGFKLGVSAETLLAIVNDKSEQLCYAKNPKRLAVRVVIEVKELEL